MDAEHDQVFMRPGMVPSTVEGAAELEDESTAIYTPQYQRFLLRTRSYTQQFSHIYTRRTHALREVTLAAARAKWGGDAASFDRLRVCGKIIDLRPQAGVAGDQEVLVIGCVYKDQPLKPSILEEYGAERGVEAPVQSRSNYASLNDTMVLEDESGRVALAAGTWHAALHGGMAHSTFRARFPLTLLTRTCPTGVILAARGYVRDTGEFAICDVAVPGLRSMPVPMAPPPAAPVPRAPALARGPVYILLASGLRVGDQSSPTAGGPDPGVHALALAALADYVTGAAGDVASSARIMRVILAGNTVGASARTIAHAAPHTSAADADMAAAPLRETDAFLTSLCSSVCVDIMPGENDPANYTWPQQPMHNGLFPTARMFSHNDAGAHKYASLRTVTNPYDASIAGVNVCGSSGQAVADIARYTHVSGGKEHVMWPGDESGLVARAQAHAATATGADEDAAMDEGEDARDRAAVDAFTQIAGTGAHTHADVLEDDETAAAAAAVNAGAVIAGECASPSHMSVLSNSLMWRHLCVTGPDTLACYPFPDADPFIITTLPDVLFSGNAPAFDTRLVKDETVKGRTGGGARVRLVCVPDFSRTRSVVLVDIASPDLATREVRIEMI